jgi:hypothetical protein
MPPSQTCLNKAAACTGSFVTPSRAFLKAFADFQGPARESLVAKERRKQGKPVDLTAQIARN